MTIKSKFFSVVFVGHKGLVTRLFLGLLLAVTLTVFVSPAAAQVPVSLMPPPKPQYFTVSGLPLSFGCLFTYQQNTTTPLPTYTDVTGTVQNTNPVILSAGGEASIWIQAGQAYTVIAKSSGGSNCSLGSVRYTVNGVGGGTSTLTSIVTYSATPIFAVQAQNQLFKITLTGNASAQPLTAVGITPPGLITWEITQDNAGAHTFSWPANSVGGCTIGAAANQVTLQHFIWDGTNAIATGGCVIGNGPAVNVGTVNAATSVTSPKIISSTANPAGAGFIEAAHADQVCWNSLPIGTNECISLDGSSNLLWPVGLSLGGGSVLATTNQSGTGSIAMSTSPQLTTPALNGVTVSGTPSTGQVLTATSSAAASWAGTAASFNAPQRVALGSDTALTGNVNTTILTESVTFPAAAGNYRADVRYGLYITAGANACAAQAVDATNSRGFALSAQNANGTGYMGLSGSEISTQTYAASSTATFNLIVVCNAGTTATKNSGLFTFTPNEVSYLSVTPVLSN